MIKKFSPCLKGYGIYALLAPVTIALEVILEIFIPFLMAQIIDIGIANEDYNYIWQRGALMVAMALLSLLCGALSGAFAAKASTGLAYGVRKKLYGKIQDFSFANVDKFSTASLVTRMTTDVNAVQQAFMMIIRSCMRSPLMLFTATFMAFRLNAQLASVFLVAIPVLAFALYFIASKAYPRFAEMFKKYDYMNRRIQETLIAIRVVKSFVKGDYEIKEFEKAADGVRAAQVKAEKLIISNMPIMQLTMYSCIVTICLLGGINIVGGRMETGALMGVISYVTQILMSLMMLSFVFVSLVMTRASMQRISEVFDEVPDIRDNQGADAAVSDGSVEFRNVSFSYSKSKENTVLSDIDLKISSGETVGIIGATGSAKTTLVQLIPRLYDVTGGAVYVGGHDVRDYKIETLRESVAMVLQKNVLFTGTIRDNLKWGNENASEEDIIKASKEAQAHDFIMSLPGGYETELGQGGVNISGGQKQRLCIARALLKHPKIIILDDSTSAVDTATDSLIRKAFRENLDRVTTIIIAQRIASVIDADKIVVMDEGRINAVGTHSELLQSNNIYREIFQSQRKGEE